MFVIQSFMINETEEEAKKRKMNSRPVYLPQNPLDRRRTICHVQIKRSRTEWTWIFKIVDLRLLQDPSFFHQSHHAKDGIVKKWERNYANEIGICGCVRSCAEFEAVAAAPFFPRFRRPRAVSNSRRNVGGNGRPAGNESRKETGELSEVR